MSSIAEPTPPTRMIDTGDLRAEVLTFAGHLDALVIHLGNRGGADAEARRQLSMAAVEVEFSVRHRVSLDPAVIGAACRNALALLEEGYEGPAIVLHARARTAGRVLLRRLSDVE